MLVKGKPHNTIWLNEKDNRFFLVIDQKLLPHEVKIVDVHSSDKTAEIIKDMTVRGAPLIGVTAAYGMYLATLEATNENVDSYLEAVYKKLAATRPTAVNLIWALNKMRAEISKVSTLEEKRKTALENANKIKADDIEKITPADTVGDQLTGGYVIKVDKATGGPSLSWNSPYNSKVKYLYHDPEDSELTTTQENYIKNYVINFENITNGAGFANPITGYPSVIDVNSFIDFMIMQELGRTVDGYRSSSFLYKDKNSKGGLLKAGPMWDFNLSYGNADYCDAYDTTGYQYNFNLTCGSTFTSNVPFYWTKFLQDSNYCNRLQCRWRNLRNSILDDDSIKKRIDDAAVILNESQARNFAQWPILGVYVNWNYFIGNTYQEEVDYLKWWFRARSKWLDLNWPGKCYDVGITEKTPNPIAWQAYPNPASEFFFVKVQEPFMINNAEFSLRDALGREVVRRDNISENELIILRGNLPDGIYHFHLNQNGKTLLSGKVVFIGK